MTVKMDEKFASGLRAALVEHVEATSALRRRTPWHVSLGAGIGVLLVGGGIAVAAGVLPLPGADVVTPLAASVTGTGTGTGTLELGNPPTGATVIDIKLTCLTAGTFFTADGASLMCTAGDAGHGAMGWQLPALAGQHTTEIRAGAGERWRLVATYSDVTTTVWGTNTDGLTYGVANDNGTPDLLSVIATNGKTGYVYTRDLQVPEPTGLQTGASTNKPIELPVYTSDGHTVIGQFVTNGAPGSMSAAP
ncbi:MAG: hypothetical protein JWM93_2805 [Frankiales bacterium]|nr:hypothetical protein [Frankiales bacterium]